MKLRISLFINAGRPVAKVTAKSLCRPLWLQNYPKCSGPGVAHIILTVTDSGSPQLTSYRRVILTVDPAVAAQSPAN